MSKWFVLEGDWGGQVYLTIPIAMTTAERARQALRIIDALEWFCNDRQGASFYTQEGRPGDGVWGGMGGGLLAEDLWLHSDLKPSLQLWVTRFLRGDAPLPSPEEMTEWFFAEDWFAPHYARKGVRRKMRKAHRLATHYVGPVLVG
jgi:hypothetical protein